MTLRLLEHRLHRGRPLVVDSDTCASFRARGVTLDIPGAIGQLLRHNPAEVEAHYQAEVASRVDVLSALTADTTPRALAEVGMQHRAALLTGVAVELARDVVVAHQRPIVVAGVLGSETVSPMAADRLHEELSEHAARVAAAGVDLIVARGQGSRVGLMAAVVAAAATELPTWAIVECVPDTDLTSGPVSDLVESLEEAGATAILFEVRSVREGLVHLEQGLLAAQASVLGVLLAGGDHSVPGFPDETADPGRWAKHAIDLDAAGARIIGGGAGTTEANTAALVEELGAIHPSIPSPGVR